MKIIAIARMNAGVDPAVIEANQLSEASATWDLYQSDFLREFYFRADGPGVVLMVEAGSIEEAQVRLDTVPMVKAGVLDWQLTPLKPFPVFAHLFASDKRAASAARSQTSSFSEALR